LREAVIKALQGTIGINQVRGDGPKMGSKNAKYQVVKNDETIEKTEESQIDILVAEDNEVNQILFRTILESTGWRFKIAENGEEAVDFEARYRPKLILMDVSMPVMNGHEATRAIRHKEQDTDRRIAIIGVTAHAIEGDREKCLEAGMDDYLSKPISPDKLEEKIAHWMVKIGAENSSEQQNPLLKA
jgi:CheY-like chemotaxis protein